MSRSDSQQITDTAKAQNATQYGNSQNSYVQAQQDAGDYQASLAKYAAGNPYTPGGEFQSTTNRQLSSTADAAAEAAGQALQGQAVRTGTNAGGAIAATEASEEANERGLGSDEAAATQARIAAKAGYDGSVLPATAAGESMESGLATGEGGLAEGNLGQENTASAANKSFMDQFGGAFASGLGTVAAKGIGANPIFGGGKK